MMEKRSIGNWMKIIESMAPYFSNSLASRGDFILPASASSNSFFWTLALNSGEIPKPRKSLPSKKLGHFLLKTAAHSGLINRSALSNKTEGCREGLQEPPINISTSSKVRVSSRVGQDRRESGGEKAECLRLNLR